MDDATLPRKQGMCQMFARLLYEGYYGDRFEFAHLPSARRAGMAFFAAGLTVPRDQGSRVGDLLYKLYGSGGFGHVGIRVSGNRVLENSSIHWNGLSAIGTRSLAQYGHFDLIVRLD
jgi:hypothetical protein